MSIRWIILITLCAAMGAMAQTEPSAQTPAAPKTRTDVMPPAREARQVPANIQEGKVVKMDLEKQRLDLAIIGEDGKPDTRSFALDNGTRVYRRAQQIILKDVKTGDHARIQYTPKEGGMPVAKRITLMPAPAPPASDHAATKPR